MVYLMYLHVLIVFAMQYHMFAFIFHMQCACLVIVFLCGSVIAKLCTSWHVLELSIRWSRVLMNRVTAVVH